MTCHRLSASTVKAALASGVAIVVFLIAAPVRAADNKVERGEYLVNTSGCHDCHTPLTMGKDGPEPDMTQMLAGHPAALEMPPVPPLPDGPWQVIASATNTAWAGPWGVSFTRNLTPDADTGLGQWTLDNFVKTFRTGRRQGRGREILPPMPIPAYKNFNDADLEAIYTYLRSIPPIRNDVPEPIAPQPAGAIGKK
jgi:hypothetical protein